MRARLANWIDLRLAPSPSALLSTTSRSDALNPSQWSDIPWRAFMFQIGTMSELPMVVIDRQLQHPELDGIERIDAARPPLGILVHPVVFAALLLERAARGGNQQEAILHPLPPRELREAGDRVEELAGIEARIGGDGLQELHVGLRVDLIAGAGGDQRAAARARSSGPTPCGRTRS